MSRPRQGPRLVRLPKKDNWYIKDGERRTADKRCITLSTRTDNREEAECFLASYIAAKAKPLSPTISQLLDIRLEDLKARGVFRARDNAYLHKALKTQFGRLEPSQVSTPLISKFRETYSHSVSMQRELLLELRMTFNMAIRDGLIEKAPYIKVPDKNPPRDRFLTKLEAAALMKAATSAHVKLFIHLALVTGARKGALLGLTWDRVNLETKRLDFNDPNMAVTKKRRSTAPITQQTVELLQEAKKFSETEYVIEYMGKPIKDIKTAFNRAVEKADLKDVTPHVLKHTAISWLSQGGHSIEKISELTATHANTVRRIYRKFAPEFLQEEASFLGKCVDFANEFAKLDQIEQRQSAT